MTKENDCNLEMKRDVARLELRAGSTDETCKSTFHDSSVGQTLDIVSVLPVELSLKILSYLTIFELCQPVSRVCRRWHQLSRDLSLWTELDVSESDRSDIGHEQLISITHQLTRLKKLSFAGRDDLNLVTLIELCPFLTFLKCLNLGFSQNINRPCLKAISLHCQELEELNLEGCPKVAHRCLTALENLQLKSLNLSHCDRLEESDIVNFLQCQTRLRCLDIDGIPCMSLPACQKIAELSPTLTILHVDGASMEDECLEFLCRCANLTELHISFCDLFTDTGLCCLQSMDHLSSLCLTKERV